MIRDRARDAVLVAWLYVVGVLFYWLTGPAPSRRAWRIVAVTGLTLAFLLGATFPYTWVRT